MNEGEFLFLTGVSGAGKSTIFRLLMGLEKPDQGNIYFDNKEVQTISDHEMPLHRRSIGMVFQDYKLLEKKSAKENIIIPLRIAGIPKVMREYKVNVIAKKLQIEHLLNQKVKTLSGGEQQLIAIARAAITDPKVILADEPTANLDMKTAQKIFSILTLLNETGTTIIIATHDIQLIKSAERQKRTLLLKNNGLFEVR